ncbi:MAG: carboxypeptidase regulatory-like domain-containing protein, partial [Pseudomonadota bacterium]|nr:carboxypeptidase regulatory-like domain-containing protein [Pseudomonadota bacterium]
ITGGIGDEQRSMLEAAQKEYNLHVLSAERDGSFVAETRVVIRDRKGNALVDTSAGPLFYAKLPSGSYSVEASNEGQSKKQNVTIDSRKASSINFNW